ncbi:MAG: hypothetical protein QM767_06260 [Anaeromyxobacter sp.]
METTQKNRACVRERSISSSMTARRSVLITFSRSSRASVATL